jgi:hypothetical protein
VCDYCDRLLDSLAAHEADSLPDVLQLTAERESYRMLAQQAIRQLHHLSVEKGRLQDRHIRLLGELRALRTGGGNGGRTA